MGRPKNKLATNITCGIYQLICNGKKYIGYSSQINTRFKQHLYTLRKGVHSSSRFQSEFDNGIQTLEISILEECRDGEYKHILIEKEKAWIDKIQPSLNMEILL